MGKPSSRKRYEVRFVAEKRVQRASRPARQTWCLARISSTVRPRTAETSVVARVASEGAFSRAVRTTASGPFAVVSERRGVPLFGRSKRRERPVASSKTSAVV